jgi:hypothetical protein
VKTAGNTASVHAQAYAISAALSQYLWWTVPIDAYVFPGSAVVPTNGTAILDTGTATNKLPAAVADAVNAAFDPPALYNAAYDAYIVPCNATAPTFSVSLGGVAFAMDPQDMILSLDVTDADGTEICVSSTQSSGANLHGLFILCVLAHIGDAWTDPWLQRRCLPQQRRGYVPDRCECHNADGA